MHSYSALYYPFIHFKDDNWLKLSALYWDRMGRIVPYEYETKDSDTVTELGDFVETLRPDWVRPEFGKMFVQFVGKHGPALRKHYDIRNRDKWEKVPPEKRPPAAGGALGEDPRLGYVFYEKMNENVRKVLVESHIAIVDPGDHRWVGMHPKLALVYMTAFADQLAGEHGLYPLTDETVDHLAMSGCTIERLAHALLEDVTLVEMNANAHEVETMAALLAIQMVVPQNLTTLPVEKILKFRQEYPAERAAFQQLIEEFLKSREWLSKIRDRKALVDRLTDEYQKTLKPKIDELREKLREAKIDTALSCMNIKSVLPEAAAPALTAMGVGVDPITASVAGFAWAAIPIVRDKRKARKEALRSADVSFLYRAEQELVPETLVKRVLSGLPRFRFGGS